MIKMSDDNNWFEVAPIRNTSKKTAWYLSTNISSLRFGACAGAMNGWVDGGGAKESREKKARRAKARPVLRAAVAACSVVSALGCQQRLYPRWCVGHRHVIDQLVEPPRADDRRSTRWCHLNPRRRKAKKKGTLGNQTRSRVPDPITIRWFFCETQSPVQAGKTSSASVWTAPTGSWLRRIDWLRRHG